MSGGKKTLKVNTYNDVYYPTVTFVHKVVDEKSDFSREINTQPVVLADAVKKMEEPKRRRRFGVWSRMSSVLVVIIAVVAVILVGMRLAGFKTFTVMSGSMEPNYPVGSMIYVKPVDYKSLKIGDVISFVADEKNTVVTHRIVDVVADVEDATILRFRTKGDANNNDDGKLVHYKNILGTPIMIIPQIGYFAHNIQQPPGIYIILVVGTLLLAWTFLPGTLEERRKTARKNIA